MHMVYCKHFFSIQARKHRNMQPSLHKSVLPHVYSVMEWPMLMDVIIRCRQMVWYERKQYVFPLALCCVCRRLLVPLQHHISLLRLLSHLLFRFSQWWDGWMSPSTPCEILINPSSQLFLLSSQSRENKDPAETVQSKKKLSMWCLCISERMEGYVGLLGLDGKISIEQTKDLFPSITPSGAQKWRQR